MPELRPAATDTTHLSRTGAAVLDSLVSRGFAVYLWGFSAIDAYLGRSGSAETLVLTNADTADLARIFDDLRYPGVDLADAAVDSKDGACYFCCADLGEVPATSTVTAGTASTAVARIFSDMGPFTQGEGRRPSLSFLDFFQDWQTKRFFDTGEIYSFLRQCRDTTRDDSESLAPVCKIKRDVERNRTLMDWALILAHYVLGETQPKNAPNFQNLNKGPPPSLEEQRLLLAGLLTAPNPSLGLEALRLNGFLEEYWPELACLNDVDHSKEFHPEGNVWQHTLETLRYRKPNGGAFDLRLSLALLLHDSGKPLAETTGSHRFDGHAQLGERQTYHFLERLEFNPALITDVAFLVRNHMLPAAVPRLSLSRTETAMSSPLFPTLLELYRCDESSSFKGLDGYYESSAAYQSYLRFRRNPYRTADGKKLKQNRRPFG